MGFVVILTTASHHYVYVCAICSYSHLSLSRFTIPTSPPPPIYCVVAKARTKKEYLTRYKPSFHISSLSIVIIIS